MDLVGERARARDFAALTALAEGDDEAVRCKALGVVAWARGGDVVQAHLRAVGNERCGWKPRAESAFRLAEELTGDERRPAVAALAPLLTAQEPELRWNVARALGHLAHPDALPALLACAGDSNKFVAAWCVWSRCRIETPDDSCRKPNMNLTNGKPAP